MGADASFIVTGPSAIHGTVAVGGAKNEALKLFAAALLSDGPVTIRRVPDIEDVRHMAEIVRALGATVTAGPHEYTIDAATLRNAELPAERMGKLRAGLVMIGPLLHRFGTLTLPLPGGDAIGRRPIDFFIQGFRAFGVQVEEEADAVRFTARALAPAHFVFPFVSVTGTEALMLFAVRVPGTTILENVAMEPEVVALGEFLNACGARITGLGTPTMRVVGVDRLSGGEVACIPDRVEAVTFAALTASCGGSLTITGCDPAHLQVPIAFLRSMGAAIDADAATGSMHIRVDGPLRAMPLRTHEYPGMATDFQPPLTVALTQAHGVALVHETIYEGRLFYIDRLNKMGANIILCDPHRCVVEGPRPLAAATLGSPDIRAGIALVIAAAAAQGVSTIHNVSQIDRGFEQIEQRLRAIGVDIRRTET
ncbi:MAG: UDP-N-acetylglucosamine 1-carboxyvinyltransferase [bacterium]|nr:UDP-N-acetylglucosamine 1-carboxyvinyltransferase [bacterium]